MATSDCEVAFDNNPDISGVGVRISFYLQTLLLVVLVDRSWEDAPSALYTLIATSGGLQIAAIVQAKVGKLSLLQALQVSNLVWLANFGTFVALASYSRQKAKSNKRARESHNAAKKRGRLLDSHVKYVAILQTLVSMALTLYMWFTAKTFGPEARCSSLIQYVFFVIRAPALGAGRSAGIAISVLLAVAYICVTAHELRSSYLKRHQGMQRKNSPAVQNSTASVVYPLPIVALATPLRAVFSSSSERLPLETPSSSSPEPIKRHKRRRSTKHRWSTDLDPMFVGIMICYAMVLGYFVVSTELLMHFNAPDDGAVKEWGFGQILAVVVVIPSAISVTNALAEHGLKRLSKSKYFGHV